MKVDKRNLKRFKKDLKALGNVTIQIGAIGQHSSAEMSNAELLTIHEFGAPKANIPARAPIRNVFKSSRLSKVLEANIQGLTKLHTKDNGSIDIKKIAEGVGVTLENLVKASIKGRLSPANTPATLKQKKGTLPLVDSEQMINAITHGVKLK